MDPGGKIYTIDEFRCWKVENLDDEGSPPLPSPPPPPQKIIFQKDAISPKLWHFVICKYFILFRACANTKVLNTSDIL